MRPLKLSDRNLLPVDHLNIMNIETAIVLEELETDSVRVWIRM